MTGVDRARLARILGMLGSEHAGERASAALRAEAFRKRHGMAWEQMLALPAVEVVVEPEPVWTPPEPPVVSPRTGGWPIGFAVVAAWVGGAILINVY
jgi:hypothetical protein